MMVSHRIRSTALKHWACTLFLAVGGVFLLTSSGRIAGADGLAMYNVTRSLYLQGTLSAGPCTPGPESNHCVPGIDGSYYAGFGLLPSILAVPAFAAGSAAASVTGINPDRLAPMAVMFSHALFSALPVVLLAVWLVRMGYSRRAAAGVSLLYAFLSPTWHYGTKAFYSEPYFAFGLLLCCYLLSLGGGRVPCLLAGAAFGLACAARVYGVILFPALLLYGCQVQRAAGVGPAQLAGRMALFSTGLGFFGVLIAWSNLARFGEVLKTGYHLTFPTVSVLLATPFFEGLRELLFNGEVGLIVFVPWVLAVPLFWGTFRRRHPREALLVALIVLVNLVFFSKYTAWHGGWALGPRLLMSILPFLALPFAELEKVPAGAWRWKAVLPVALLSAAISLISVSYPFARYYVQQNYHYARGSAAWWDGFLLAEAAASLPAMLHHSVRSVPHGGGPMQQFLRSQPNSANLLMVDFWVVKAVRLRASGDPQAVRPYHSGPPS